MRYDLSLESITLSALWRGNHEKEERRGPSEKALDCHDPQNEGCLGEGQTVVITVVGLSFDMAELSDRLID